MFGTPFELFGSVHLITIIVIIAVTVLLPKFYKNKPEDQKSAMSIPVMPGKSGDIGIRCFKSKFNVSRMNIHDAQSVGRVLISSNKNLLIVCDAIFNNLHGP